MTLDEEVEVLKRIPLFSKIDKPKLKLLAFTSERVVFTAARRCAAKAMRAMLPSSSSTAPPIS